MATKAKKTDGGVTELIKTLVYALLLAGLIRTFLYQPFWIPSGSMKDTLLIGDFLFVNKFAYGYSSASCPSIRGSKLCFFLDDREGRIWSGDPERGDVVVFNQDGTVYIKRLIGLPGDRVQMKEGILYINDKIVPQEPIEPFVETAEMQGPQANIPQCANPSVALGASCVKDRAVETLPNGVEHSVLNIGMGGGDSTAVFNVPEGEYFFMGDNRDNSLDSRFARSRGGVGMVPIENFVGRADRIMFSSAGRSIFYFWTWRRDRFFKAVN